jgi:hypothetical protein
VDNYKPTPFPWLAPGAWRSYWQADSLTVVTGD